MFAAATGLRPGEWIALERRDIDRDARVVYVRRAPRNGRIKCPKTEGSVRAVPLQTIALEALDQLPAGSGTDLLFPSLRGAYFDLHNFRTREWTPAQVAAGITPIRRIYDLRHTFATFALRAGVSTYDLSRYMGASLTMIDRHYGHLARDGREHAINLLDKHASAAEKHGVHRVDIAWTLHRQAVATEANPNGLIAGEDRKPSDGLEPSTPSLPCCRRLLTYARVGKSIGLFVRCLPQLAKRSFAWCCIRVVPCLFHAAGVAPPPCARLTVTMADGRDIELVLVTGAGAGVGLGVSGSKIAAMKDWANHLTGALTTRDPGIALLVGLRYGMAGIEFEQQLGSLLRVRPCLQGCTGVDDQHIAFYLGDVSAVWNVRDTAQHRGVASAVDLQDRAGVGSRS